MCDCMNEMLEKSSDIIKEDIQGKYADFKADWTGRVFRLDGKANNVMLEAGYEYQGFKKNGEKRKNLTKGSIKASMSYCPFCGEKY